MTKINKRVYSLVLSDGIVRHVDQLCRCEGSSRSAMIDRILASHFLLTTSENFTGQIVFLLSDIIDTNLFEEVQTTAQDLLIVRFPLNYKYNPMMRCTMTLKLENNALIAQFKAGVRTTSKAIKTVLPEFFLEFLGTSKYKYTNLFLSEVNVKFSIMLSKTSPKILAEDLNSFLIDMHQALQDRFSIA